ncbi:MAG: hypothetical protein GC159_14300 [Phycisphaera sp.]|nr:hypothetical protein [Phycisphaera sp.]
MSASSFSKFSRLYAVVAMCILIYAQPASAAGQADELFNSLYGDSYKSAAASSSPNDDVTLAAQLLEAATTSASEHPDLLKLLCEKAVELGKKDPSGYASAISALNLLIEKFPNDSFKYKPQVVELYQAWFIRSRGDEKKLVGQALLQQLITQANNEREKKLFDEADKTYRRSLAVASAVDNDARKSVMDALQSLREERDIYDSIDKAKAVLQLNPDDAASKKALLQAYLVDLDDPTEAAKYADADPKAKAMLPLMTGDVEVLSPLAWLDLADWQSELAGTTKSDISKAKLLSHSLSNYQKFLAEHQDKDLSRTKAELASQKIEGSLKAMGYPSTGVTLTSSSSAASSPLTNSFTTTTPPDATAHLLKPTGASGAIDLLSMLDPDAHAKSGKWWRDGGGISGRGKDNRSSNIHSQIEVPVAMTGDYAIDLTFARKDGEQGMGIQLPVGDTAVWLIVGGNRGSGSALTQIDGLNSGASGNPTRKDIAPLHDGQERKVHAAVKVRGANAEIVATLDSQTIVEWRGRISSLTVDGSTIRNGALGLLSLDNTTIAFSNLTVTALSGSVKSLNGSGAANAVATNTPKDIRTIPSSRPLTVPPAIASGKSIDLLKAVDLSNAVGGKWVMQGNTLASMDDKQFSRFSFPVHPEGDYELNIEMERAEGNDAATIMLPVADKQLAISLGWKKGGRNSLEYVGGPRRTLFSQQQNVIQTGKRHAVVIRVIERNGHSLRDHAPIW